MERPRIKITLDSWDYMIEIFGGLCIIMMIVWPSVYYVDLPESIPKHYNALGEPDAFGSKSSIWILPAVGLVMYAGMFALNRFPHIFNYPTQITQENAERQYRNATKLVRIINMLMAASFFYIELTTVQTALNKQEGLGVLFLPIFIGLTFLVIGIYMSQSVRSNKFS